MRAVASVLALLLLAPAAASAASLPVPLQDAAGRDYAAPIRIVGDAAFAEEGSGVRSGSGTPEDPYVISSWHVLADRRAAVHLQDTRAHVVIRDVVDSEGTQGRVGARTVCLPEWTCDVGLVLENASNVVVEGFHTMSRTYGAQLRGASDVVVRGLELGASGSGSRVARGFLVQDSERVLLDGVRGRVASGIGTIWESRDVTVTGIAWGSNEGSLYVLDAERVDVRDSTFGKAQFVLGAGAREVGLVRSSFAGGWSGVWEYESRADAFFLCGSTFTGSARWGAVSLRHVTNTTAIGNAFVGNRGGFEIQLSPDVRFERNLVKDNADFGALLHAELTVARNNSFSGSGWGSAAHAPGDLRHNWWGDPSGPSGVGPGSGEIVRGDAPFEPWLVAPPELAVDCDAEARPGRTPVLPVTHYESVRLDGAWASLSQYRLAPDAHLQQSIRYELQRGGVSAWSLFFMIDHGLPTAWGFALSSQSADDLPSLDLEHDGVRLNVSVPASGGSVGIELECPATRCPASLLVMAGASPGVVATTSTTLVRSAVAGSGVDIVRTDRTGLVTLREMEGERVEASAGQLVVRHAENVTATLRADERMWAYSRWAGPSSNLHASSTFTVESPEGEKPADRAFFLASAPGEYAYRASQTTAPQAEGPMILWADLPAPS